MKARRIRLTQGFVALVDAADYERLSRFRWYAVRSGRRVYAQRCSGGRKLNMHAEIMGQQEGKEVDHLRHPQPGRRVLDNRRSNLRWVTRRQNCANRRRWAKPKTSLFKGVHLNRRTQRWRSVIGRNGRRELLGTFRVEAYAALVYDLEAVKTFGEFALTNFPVPGSTNSIFS